MAAIVASTTVLTTLHLSKPTSLTFIHLSNPTRHLRSLITSSTRSNTSESSTTFSPPTTKQPLPKRDSLSDQLFIPWAVPDEKGNLKPQTTPSQRFLKALAHESTQKKKKKDTPTNKINNPNNAKPQYSKAARRFYNERFREPPQRLAKVLAAAGVASRRSSEELIFQGKVTVNGSVCSTPQTKVDPGQDIIYVNGSRLAKKLPPKLYLALNKPKGYICSAGENETKTVFTLFDDFFQSWNKRNPGVPKPRLFTVGRLDVATTGLIIVTNDGEFAQKVSHPSSNLSKEYIATINGAVNKRQLLTISEGTIVEGVHCTPESVELLPQQPDISRPRIRIVVHEGRNHEVRELVKHAGLEIYGLKRVRIGGFRLPSDLGIGKHKELNTASLRSLGWKS